MANKKLAGKVAVVTGASKGIGAGIAKYLAVEGASVVVNYASSRDGADQVVNEIVKEGGQAIAVQADVAKKKDIERLFAETKKAFGRLDILVNNAGVYEFSPLENVTDEHFHKHFDVNVLGLLLASQAALKYFGPDGGSIINISSGASTLTPPNTSVYSATKAAVDAITRTLAKELGPRRITANVVAPGPIQTDFSGGMVRDNPEVNKQIAAMTALGRPGVPDDIGPMIAALLSDENRWVNAQRIEVSGGLAL